MFAWWYQGETAHSQNGDHFWNYVLCEKMLSLIYHWTRAFSLNALFCSIFEKSLCRGLNGLNWCSLDNCISKWWPSLRNDKNPFHFKFNRITGLDAACEQLPEKGEKCAGMVQCVANESVCCMNYQWEDGCGLAELKRFRLRCPLTAHWFDISIIDSKGDSDSWAAQSQLFSWFEASWTCTQVEGLVGDY